MAFKVSAKVHLVHGRLKQPIGHFAPGAGAASKGATSASSAAPAMITVPSPMNSRLVRSMVPS